MDRGTCRTYVSLKVEDPNLERFSTTQYNNAIALAEQQFGLDTRVLVKETTLTCVVAETEIALPTDFLTSVLVRHKGIKLDPTSKADLAFQAGTDWTTITGTPRMYYIDEEDEKVGLFPQPLAADAGANVTLNYAAVPAEISSDGTVLLNAKALLAQYHPAVVAYAAFWMLGYLPTTPEVRTKRGDCLTEYTIYRDRALDTYKNMADAPPRMSGGREWQGQIIKSQGNAFDT